MPGVKKHHTGWTIVVKGTGEGEVRGLIFTGKTSLIGNIGELILNIPVWSPGGFLPSDNCLELNTKTISGHT